MRGVGSASRSLIRLLLITAIWGYLFASNASWGQQVGTSICVNEARWTPTWEWLDGALRHHLVWLDLQGWQDETLPGRLVLCNADLTAWPGLDLSNLTRADLRGANLSGVFSYGSDFAGAELAGADLSHAILFVGDFSRANLAGANLSRTQVVSANFTGAILVNANLSRAQVSTANFSGANLANANLSEANLRHANFAEANLISADMSGAALAFADLSGANLQSADLSNADLSDANLSRAELAATTLSNTRIAGTNITDARLQTFGSPERDTLYDIHGLDQVVFAEGRGSALVALRNQLREIGQRDLERAATYAIERNRMRHGFASSDPLDWLSATISAVFFWLPAAFGFDHGRPLVIILAGTMVMAFPYAWFAWRPSSVRPQSGGSAVYRVFPQGRIIEDSYVTLSTGSELVERVRSPSYAAALPLGLYISFLSSFRIGTRNVNIGAWASRLQKREYEYRVVGWPRVLAGLQSVFSLYMLIAWLLFTFGRPLQ